jgi:hypothetical protein
MLEETRDQVLAELEELKAQQARLVSQMRELRGHMEAVEREKEQTEDQLQAVSAEYSCAASYVFLLGLNATLELMSAGTGLPWLPEKIACNTRVGVGRNRVIVVALLSSDCSTLIASICRYRQSLTHE